MKVGLDTGFLLKLYTRDRKVLEIWKRFTDRDIEVATNLLCGYEFLKVLSVRGIKFARLKDFWEGFREGVEVIGVTDDLIQKGARLEVRHRLGALDSLILAGFLEAGCREVFTTDKRWRERVTGLRVKII